MTDITIGWTVLSGPRAGAHITPGLDAMIARFIDKLPELLRSLTALQVTTRLARVERVCLATLAGTDDAATMLAPFQVEAWNEAGIVAADARLCSALPAALLGGSRPATPVAYTAVHRRLIDRLFGTVMQAFAASQAGAAIRVRVDRATEDILGLGVAPDVGMVSIRLDCTVADAGGTLMLLLPAGLLRAIDNADADGRSLPVDPDWRDRLARRLLRCTLEPEATLLDEALPLRDVVGSRVGGLLRFATPPRDAGRLCVGGTEIARGSVAVDQGRTVIVLRGDRAEAMCA